MRVFRFLDCRCVMLFYVKCVQCGRVAGVQFTKPVSMNTEEEETPEHNIHLDGYIVKCPGAASSERCETHPLQCGWK